MSTDEANRVRLHASAAGLSVSEWTRRALLESVECPAWARLMLGEFLALRSVVVDLQRDLIQGVNPSTERVKAILVLGNLKEAGKAFRMMPGPEDNRPVFTITDWAKQRRGWIFVTSTPDTIDAVRPLQSLWLDMLILKLQGGKRPALLNWFGRAQRFCGFRPATPILPRVWLMIDELADLNALPQLHKALTKQRKSGNPICLGFQGMSQLDALYGKKAETILSSTARSATVLTTLPTPDSLGPKSTHSRAG